MPFVVGENIGPYRIIEQLGQGGMATVFKAYHPALARYVAIKALHPAFSLDPNFLVRFQREAQVVAKLEHPNIVPVYDYSEHEGRPYLVMKYIEGETLKARLGRGRLEQKELMQIVESIGAGLEYAHSQGVLHRDVKPSNVLLAQDGRIYLADFGLARMAEAGESTISSDVMMGTPQYISPEQAMGQRDLDRGTDIYSFGVLLYELLVGNVPFSADTPYSIIHDHIYAPLPLPRQRNPYISEAVELVLLKALAKERADRYPDVTSMMEALKAAWESQPEIPAPATLVEARSGSVATGTRFEAIAPESQPMPAPAQEAALVEKPKRKSRSIWLWLGIGLTVCVCLALALGAVNRAQRRAALVTAQAQETVIQLTSQAIGPSAVAPTQAPPKPSTPPPEQPPADDPISRAQELVDANPQDPQAHFQLARAYWEAGRWQEAERAYKRARELAGKDPDFYVQAGEFFIQHEMWVFAASAYLAAYELLPPTKPPEVVDRLHMAFYRAAADPGSAGIFEDAEGKVEPEMLGVARARAVLHRGQIERARELLSRLRQGGVQIPEASLLEAEIFFRSGDKPAALPILKTLSEDPATPEWIREIARSILKEIQP